MGDLKGYGKQINAFATSCYRVMLNISALTMFWTPPSIPWLTLCLWFIWLGTASWNFLVTSSECQRKSLLEDIVCTFLPLAKGDLVDHVLHIYLNYVQRLLGDNEGAMQEQQIVAFADDRHAWRNLVIACSAADGWWWWWLSMINLYNCFQRVLNKNVN